MINNIGAMIPANLTTPGIDIVLSTLREEGWTDKSIAQTLGINRTTVWRWRIGSRHPHTSQAVRMALMGLLSVKPMLSAWKSEDHAI